MPFLPGDIVFQATHATGLSNPEPDHVMISIPHEEAPPRFAHATFSGVRQGKFKPEKFKEVGARLCAFRCKEEKLARLAAEYARNWAVEGGKAQVKTTYSEFWRMEQDRIRSLDIEPPFGADAVRRAFKWARRENSPISEIREGGKGGITCPLFVIASYQAAALKLHFNDVLDIYESIVREMKFTNDQEYMLKTFGYDKTRWPRYFVGVNGIRKKIVNSVQLNELFGEDLKKFFEPVMTRAMLMDAKYAHVPLMFRRLQEDQDSWARVVDWKPLEDSDLR